MRPLPPPNWKAKPIAKYRMPHRHVSKTHSIMMLTVSRDRANPASRAMNPACMKNTRKAATSTHIVLMGLMVFTASAASWTGDAPATSAKKKPNSFIAPSTPAMPIIFAPKIAPKARRTSGSLNRWSRCAMKANVRIQGYVIIRRECPLRVMFLSPL